MLNFRDQNRKCKKKNTKKQRSHIARIKNTHSTYRTTHNTIYAHDIINNCSYNFQTLSGNFLVISW